MTVQNNAVPRALVNYSQAPSSGTYQVSDANAYNTLRTDFPQAAYPYLSDQALQQLVDQADSNNTGMLTGKNIDALIAALVTMLENGGEGASQILGQIASLMGLTPPSGEVASPEQQSTGDAAAQQAIVDGNNTNAQSSGTGTGGASGTGSTANNGGSAATAPDGQTAELQGAGGTPYANSTQTKDGYTVSDCYNDMVKLWENQGNGAPSAQMQTQMQTIAQGIISGVNTDFPGVSSGKSMAQTLIASAYKESKFGTAGEDGGGVFQCAPNRYADYLQAHGGQAPAGIGSYSDMNSTNPAQMASQIQVSLWAMAHPATGLGTIAGVPFPSSTEQQALYLWNYNPSQLQDYMNVTSQYEQLLAG